MHGFILTPIFDEEYFCPDDTCAVDLDVYRLDERSSVVVFRDGNESAVNIVLVEKREDDVHVVPLNEDPINYDFEKCQVGRFGKHVLFMWPGASYDLYEEEESQAVKTPCANSIYSSRKRRR